MKRSGVLLCLFISFLAVPFMLAVAGDAHAGEKVIRLNHSSQFPANHPMAQPVKDWAKEIEKRTDGRVKITVYFSGTLTSPAACYEGVVRGQSDIGEAVLSMTRGRFPLMEAVELPGYPFNAIVTSKVSHELYKKFRPKELDETHVLYIHNHIPAGFHTRTKAVRKLEDMKGLRIRCTGLAAKIGQALGATPVTMPKGETYDALQRGLVDGTMGAPNDILGWKLAEVTKYCTLHPTAGYTAAFATVMNKAKWNSLPPDIQKVFTDVSEEWVIYTGKVWNHGETAAFDYSRKKGEKRFIILPPAEGARWDKALVPVIEGYEKAMKAKGLPGAEVLKYRQELIEKYNKQYPPLKMN